MKSTSPPLFVSPGDHDFQLIPDHEPSALVAPDEGDSVIVNFVEIVVQGGDVDKALDEELVQFHEEADGDDAGDGAGELRAEVLLHELGGFHLDRIARGGVGADFGSGDGAAQVLVEGEVVGFGESAVAEDDTVDLTVHDEVRVAADGRGEVA